MTKSDEEQRAEAAVKTAKANRQKELDRRAASKQAQAKAKAGVHRPLVG